MNYTQINHACLAHVVQVKMVGHAYAITWKLLFLTASICAYRASGSPLQFFYVDDSASMKVSLTSNPRKHHLGHLGRVDGSCEVTAWTGTDPDGMSGYPSATLVRCDTDSKSSWSADGMVNTAGHLRFYLWYGFMSVRDQDGNEQESDIVGTSMWFAGGTAIHVKVTGAFYVVGSPLALARVPPSLNTSSYNGLRSRYYNMLLGPLVHDPHINNGTGHVAKDILFPSLSGVDPPNIIVLNCAPSLNKKSYVYSHSHPQGAVYIPFSGKICFTTDKKRCISSGQMRWTSANLYYPESFEVDPNDAFGELNKAREQIIDLAWVANITDSKRLGQCNHSVVFAVTNFDPADHSGQPNFVSVPDNVRPSANPPTRWGYWSSLVVRSTVVRTTTSCLSPEQDSDTDVGPSGHENTDIGPSGHENTDVGPSGHENTMGSMDPRLYDEQNSDVVMVHG